MGSENREPSSFADGQYQYIPGVSSPTAVGTGLVPVRQQGTDPSSERIEEPAYQEHMGNLSGQPTVEAPSFYAADLLNRQLQGWQSPPAQPQQKNGAYPSNQQQAYSAVPPISASMPQQGPVPYAPNGQYPPNPPYGQQYRGASISYTNPQVYQQPSNGYAQQPQPSAAD